MVGQAFGLVRRSRVLLALIAVELFWGFGMITFEGLLPVRLAEVVGDPDRAAALLGPAGAVAWLACAAGAACVPLLSRRSAPPSPPPCCGSCRASRWSGWDCSPARSGCWSPTSLLRGARRRQPAAHGTAAPPGRRAVPDQRLCLNSMVAKPGAGLGGIVLTALADSAGVTTAMLAGAVVLALAAPLCPPGLPADRAADSSARRARRGRSGGRSRQRERGHRSVVNASVHSRKLIYGVAEGGGRVSSPRTTTPGTPTGGPDARHRRRRCLRHRAPARPAEHQLRRPRPVQRPHHDAHRLPAALPLPGRRRHRPAAPAAAAVAAGTGAAARAAADPPIATAPARPRRRVSGTGASAGRYCLA